MRSSPLSDQGHAADSAHSLPKVGVHALGEFVYCHRAGQIAFERLKDDEGTDMAVPRLDYDPFYDPRRIHEALTQVTATLKVTAQSSVLIGLMWLALTWFDSAMGIIVAVCVITFLGPWLWDKIEFYRFLRRRLRCLKAASDLTVDFHSPIEQSVNWWQMIRFGFESIEPRAIYRDEQAGLQGKPFRILHWRSLRIPVILACGDGNVRRKHRLRLAAYAQLIELNESGQVPFGVVLFAGSDDAVIVPITIALRDELRQELWAFRQQLAAVAAGLSVPGAPSNQNLCRNCPFAKPRIYRKGQSESVFAEVKAAPYFLDLGKGLKGHCDCGDRFRWVPPA